MLSKPVADLSQSSLLGSSTRSSMFFVASTYSEYQIQPLLQCVAIVTIMVLCSHVAPFERDAADRGRSPRTLDELSPSLSLHISNNAVSQLQIEADTLNGSLQDEKGSPRKRIGRFVRRFDVVGGETGDRKLCGAT